MQTRRFLQSSSLYLIANLASRAVGFVMLPVYSRFLTPREYGSVELIELTIQVVSLCIGVQSIGGAMIRIFHDREDEKWRAGVVSTALIGGFIFNIALALIGLLGAAPISRYILHVPNAESLVRMCAVAMMLANVVEVHLIYFRLRDWVERCVVYSLIQLFAAVALNLFFIVHLRMGVTGLLISKLITSGLGCIYLLARTVPEVGLRWSAEAARKMFTFGSPLVISNLAFFVIHFGDRWFLSGMRTMDEVGQYSLAYRFAFVVSLLVGEPFGKVWNVTLYNYTSAPDWRVQFARVARYLTFVLCFTGLGLSIFGGEIIHRMAAPAYFAAAGVLPILILAYVGREIGDFFRNVLYINKRSALVGRIALASAIVNTLLNVVLIPAWGMYGAAWATLATWFLYLALCWFSAWREHEIAFPLRSFAVPVLAGLAIYMAAVSLPEQSPVIHLGVRALLVTQFIAILWLLSYFPAQEIYYIKHKLWVVCAALRQRVVG